jgi:hypothetical protein
MIMTKKHLLATTAVAGLLLGATPAHAFDELSWTWNKTVDEAVNINVDIDSTLAPIGHVEIEQSQIMNGDIRSEVNFQGDHLSNDSTELSISEDGIVLLPQEVDFSGTFTLSGEYDANADDGPNIISSNLNSYDFENFEAVVTLESGEIEVQPSNYTFDMSIAGTASTEGMEVDLSELIEANAVTLDATTELGTLQGAAVSIANFQELETETATYLHNTQLHNALNEGGFGVEAMANAGSLENPVEAAVDLSATAISNYMSLSGAVDDANNVLIADISQETNANVSATATAFQDLTGYNNLGGFTGIDADAAGTVGRLAATAIGNFSSTSFGPSVDLSSIAE